MISEILESWLKLFTGFAQTEMFSILLISASVFCCFSIIFALVGVNR